MILRAETLIQNRHRIHRNLRKRNQRDRLIRDRLLLPIRHPIRLPKHLKPTML